MNKKFNEILFILVIVIFEFKKYYINNTDKCMDWDTLV